ILPLRVDRKQLVEPEGVIDRHTEEIPYKAVSVSGQPIRMQLSPRWRRHLQRASASEQDSKVEVALPLPVTMATETSCPAEGTPANP
ncbi:hypothetical protein ATANTOWER_026721, partial [Ataeniobius toweri]|nr:hypothetical protein [Ataeniobius toweri]